MTVKQAEGIVQITSEYDGAQLARLQTAAEADLQTIVRFETAGGITTPTAYAAFDELLTVKLRELDAAEKAKKSITGPIREGLKAVDALFKPLVAPLDASVAVMKRMMSAYQKALAEAEAAARTLALQAATKGDDSTMATALTVAADAGQAARVEVASQVRWKWTVKKVTPDLLPDEYWTPDTAKIEAVAKAADASSEEGRPVIPGVTFERVPNIAGSHK